MKIATFLPTRENWDPQGPGSLGLDSDGNPVASGEDLLDVLRAERRVLMGLSRAASWQPETLEDSFFRHAAKWRAETGFMSSIRDMATHQSYQHIIGMGRDVVPLIIRELRERPDHWFWALKAITQVDPVSPCDRGKVERMREAWIEWADVNGTAEL